jgi:hypothetical protein
MMVGAFVCNGVLGGWSRYALHFQALIPNQSIETASILCRHVVQACDIFISDVVRCSENDAEAIAPDSKTVSCAESTSERDADGHADVAANSNEAKVASGNGRSRLPLGV